jgi:hypothetical protein
MEKVTAIASIVDYAYPCMMAEKGLRKVHDAMLENNFEAAIEAAIQTLVDTKLMVNAIKDMKDANEKLRSV